jgi:radical SAM superfamily enzyme YgiQ (UPF0313 family)
MLDNWPMSLSQSDERPGDQAKLFSGGQGYVGRDRLMQMWDYVLRGEMERSFEEIILELQAQRR